MTVARTFREEHELLIEHVEEIRAIARELDRLPPPLREEPIGRVLDFLNSVLMPHAEAEERVLYPAVGELLGHPEATAPMVHDHVVIREHASRLADADLADTRTLQEVLFGLYALVHAHFRKEEDLYLPLIEADPERAALIFSELRHVELHH